MGQATLTFVMVLSFSICLHLAKQVVYWSYLELVSCNFLGQQQTLNNFSNAENIHHNWLVAMVTKNVA